MHKISIIIPLHNGEAFILDTIYSCLNQTYTNIEIIVVENGSTDNSFDKVAQIEDERVFLYSCEALNASAARNHGYNKSSGSFVSFLDADDVLALDKIERQMDILKALPNEWVVSCAWAKFHDSIEESAVVEQLVWREEDPIEWCLSAWTGNGMMIPGCWLIPRGVIEKAGVWDERLSLHDDGEFMCRVLIASKGNKFVENTLVYYRQSPNSLSRNNSSLKAAKSALAVYKSYQNVILNKRDDATVRNALAHNYIRFIYQFYPNYKELINEARQMTNQLDVEVLPLVGGRFFNKLQKLFGFYNALKLKQILNR